MNTFTQKIYLFACKFIQICMLLLTAVLFASAFMSTSLVKDMNSQRVLIGWDNAICNLFGIGLFLLFFGSIWKVLSANPARRKHFLLAITLLWCLTAGVLLLYLGRTMPSADSMSVFSMAEELAVGNTSVIHPTDSYISYYPQQIGLIAYYELIIRLWNLFPFTIRAYVAIQGINVLLACVIIFIQYRTVRLLWHNDRAECLYLLLAGTNVPLLMYTSFVYGEIPSFAAISTGFYYLLKLLHTADDNSVADKEEAVSESKMRLPKTALQMLLGILSLTLSVMLRKNSLILIIAVVLVVLLQWAKERRAALLIYAILCVFCTVSILPLTERLYEQRSGNSISSGVPAMAYFAMGMQEASRANGWYNGFNFYTYQETGLDTALTVAASRDVISERLAYFRSHPIYAMRFYLDKYLSQWADGSYACRQATYATSGGRSALLSSLYSGSYAALLVGYCNAYQNVLYLGVLLFCLYALWRHSKPSLPVYLGLIGVLGGFLFHFIWEGNARYIFLYSLLLLPYGAKGLAGLFDHYDEKTAEEKHLFFPTLLAVGMLSLLFVWTGKDAEVKKQQLNELRTASYEGVFCSMYPLTYYNAEDFVTYRGVSTLLLSQTAQSAEDISDYLAAAFSSGNPVSNVYLGLDPETLSKERRIYQELFSYIELYSDTSFEIMLPYYPESYWMSLTAEELSEAAADYVTLTRQLYAYDNTTVYFVGDQPWMISNPANYTEDHTPNAEICHHLVLLTFCDHNYVLGADSAEETLQAFTEYIVSRQVSPAEYPDLSEWDIVFFGDSIIGNFTASNSIPGTIAGLSGARTYNCAKGGAPAAVSDMDTLNFPLAVKCFYRQNVEAVTEYEVYHTSLRQYLQDDHKGRRLCFVINYGLNDYFDGYPVDDPDDPYDTSTYAGALREGIRLLKRSYPHAVIVLMTPSFTTYYENGKEHTSEESGSLTDYVDAAVKVAEERDIYCINNYFELGINAQTASRYLSDGCHPNEKGLYLFATHILSRLADLEAFR